MSNTPNTPAPGRSPRQQKANNNAAAATAAANAAPTLQVAAANEEQLSPAVLTMVDKTLDMSARFTKAREDESIVISESEIKVFNTLIKVIQNSLSEAMATAVATSNAYTDQKTTELATIFAQNLKNTNDRVDKLEAEMESDRKPSKWALFVGIALGIALGLWTWLASGIPNAGLFAWIFGAGALGLVVVIGNTFRAKRIERNPGPVVMNAKVSKPANPELESSSAGSTT